MRVRHIVSILVAVCSVGGVALSLGLAHGFNELERESMHVGASPVALSEWARLSDATAQWLTTCDLVLGSGQDLLLFDAQRQGASLERLVAHVAGVELAQAVRPDLVRMRRMVADANELLAEAERVAGSERDARLMALLAVFDSITAPLPGLIKNAEARMREVAGQYRARLEQRRERFAWVGATALSVYLALVLGVWRWTSVTVTGPLARLTEAAARAERDGRSLEFEASGPVEVRDLAVSVASFAGRLETANEVMERTITQRTAELVRSNRVKDEFLATMSHEIRTPANGVLGVLELLERTALDDQQEAWVVLATRSGRALLAIIDDILDFSRIEAGNLPLAPQAFDMRALAEEQLGLAAMQLTSPGVSLQIEVAEELPKRLVGDEGRVRQVLSNLLGNAAKFTSGGSIRLSLGCEPAGASEWEVLVRIEDTGIGIPEDRILAIFEPFTQSDGSTTREYGGTGLGLTIAKRIVESMGGAIGVWSQFGRGSAFWFTLRMPEANETVTNPGQHEVSLGARILIAEDNEVNQQVIQAMLESLGCRSECVGDGALALERLEREEFDLVLMDCHMPRMDGHQATLRIRELGVDTPIIALTAAIFDADRQRCLDAGMNDFVTKPVSVALLREVISRWLNPEGQTSEADPEGQPEEPLGEAS